ncbi:MAG: CRTAC1 family protein [Planctomycetaceae bacterium]|nr:CRTAC1 family protein [Planctomycetaceae bacterium]
MTRRSAILWMIWCALGSSVVSGQDLVQLTDVTESSGLIFHHRFGDDNLSNIVEGTGSGAVMFDYDGDGWLDVYFVCGTWHTDINDTRGRKYRGTLSNRLFRNKQDGTFEDVTEQAGVGDPDNFGFGCTAADYDGDGDLDLYVLNYHKNVLFRNNGDGTFTDVSEQSGLDNPLWSLHAPWFDYDGDGDLDVYVVNYLEYDKGEFRAFYAAAGYPGPLSYTAQADVLYRNNGDGTFTDVTQEAGIIDLDGRGMSATVTDLDNDGLLDIYVANDATDNFYFRNLGNGRFENEAVIRGLAFGEGGQGVSSMGPAVGDINRDGWLDLYIPDMGYGCLLMSQEGFFEDWTDRSRLAVICGQYAGWGGVLFDLDNDGYLDLFIANGNVHFEYPEEDVLAINDGYGLFTDVAVHSGDYFHEKYVGRGATFGDYDNDGDLDLLVVNLNGPARLLRNDGGNRQHWLKLDVRLPNGLSTAIGARVTVTAGKLVQIHDVVPVVGYLSQADPRCHFGLGTATKADRVEIRWPNGQRTELKDVAADQILTVVQDAK